MGARRFAHLVSQPHQRLGFTGCFSNRAIPLCPALLLRLLGCLFNATMRRVWSINIRNLLVSTPSKSKPSESTVELNSWYHRVGQNESQSSVEGERNGNDEDAITPDVSQGVQKAEAIALVWNKKSAYGTYAW